MLLPLLGSGWLVWDFHQPDYSPKQFTSSTWKSARPLLKASNDPGCVLGGMGLDLIKHKMLLGKSVITVADFLGEPDYKSGNEWVYELGQCSGWGLHFSELRVQFDGKIESVTSVIFRPAS